MGGGVCKRRGMSANITVFQYLNEQTTMKLRSQPKLSLYCLRNGASGLCGPRLAGTILDAYLGHSYSVMAAKDYRSSSLIVYSNPIFGQASPLG